MDYFKQKNELERKAKQESERIARTGRASPLPLARVGGASPLTRVGGASSLARVGGASPLARVGGQGRSPSCPFLPFIYERAIDAINAKGTGRT